MPPQTDKLSILRAVLAQLAGSGAIPTDAFGQTALGGQSAPNMSNRFGQAALGGSNSPSSMAAPSGFDATMRGVRLPTEPGFDATMRGMQLPQPEPGFDATMRDVQFNPQGRQNPDVTGFDASIRGQGVADRMPQGKPSKSGVKTISNKMDSDMVTAPTRQTNPDVMGFDAALRGEGASDRVRPVQSSGKPAPKVSTQASGKPASTRSQASSQQGKPSESSKSAPVAQAKPSGEALSYFRKNKTSAGWDALGTGVSLVQQSMKPEKGGLKSRAEYDRLLRGSDNFKKLEGNEQQRVRQAFAQWMNEQTIFKGKA
jgi:hypothetical protein